MQPPTSQHLDPAEPLPPLRDEPETIEIAGGRNYTRRFVVLRREASKVVLLSLTKAQRLVIARATFDLLMSLQTTRRKR